jgi:hypothetical protein
MLRYLSDLDLNIVLLDYEQKRGFGNNRLIDIWWRGGSNNGNLVLSLIKFLRTSYDWRLAKVRLMIINMEESKEAQIRKDTEVVLENMRMEAIVKIINNEKEKLPVNLIIKKESAEADLIFLGLAEVQEGMEEEFVKRADYLYKDLGTIALVNASTFFKELNIGL